MQLKLKLTIPASESVPEIKKNFFLVQMQITASAITGMQMSMVPITTAGADMRLSGKIRESKKRTHPKIVIHILL